MNSTERICEWFDENMLNATKEQKMKLRITKDMAKEFGITEDNSLLLAHLALYYLRNEGLIDKNT